MKKIISLLVISGALLTINACEKSAAQTLGLARKSPDEFSVMSRPPLSVPPDFTLRAPTDDKPPANNKKQSAGELVLGKKAPPPQNSGPEDKAELNLLQKAGAKTGDQTARDQLNQEELQNVKSAEEKDSSFFSWPSWFTSSKKPEPSEPVIDSTKEKQRIEKNLDEGKTPAEGEPAVTTPKDSGLFNKIF